MNLFTLKRLAHGNNLFLPRLGRHSDNQHESQAKIAFQTCLIPSKIKNNDEARSY